MHSVYVRAKRTDSSMDKLYSILSTIDLHPGAARIVTKLDINPHSFMANRYAESNDRLKSSLKAISSTN
jgi:hypothetical protein